MKNKLDLLINWVLLAISILLVIKMGQILSNETSIVMSSPFAYILIKVLCVSLLFFIGKLIILLLYLVGYLIVLPVGLFNWNIMKKYNNFVTRKMENFYYILG
jgi:hypothetical protein